MFEHDDDAVGEEIALSIARAERVDTVHAREKAPSAGVFIISTRGAPATPTFAMSATGVAASTLKPLVTEAEAPAVDSISHAMGHRPRGLRMAARAAAAVVGFAVVVALVGIMANQK